MIPDLPGWDSLPTVTRYQNWAEIAGIIILVFLAIAEIVAYQYGHRKDDLTQQQQTEADRRHDEEMARLHVEAANARERAAILETALQREHERNSDRMPTDEQIKVINDAIRTQFSKGMASRYTHEIVDPFPKFDIANLDGDLEAENFANLLNMKIYGGSGRERLPRPQFSPEGIAIFDPVGPTGVFATVMKRAFPDAEIETSQWIAQTGRPTLYIWRKPLRQ
jgi:hypothetical protein